MAAVFMAAAALMPDAAWACDSCWGAKVDNPTTRGVSMAMMALIGMTTAVWGGIGAFFWHVRRRTRLLEPGNTVVTESGDLRESENGRSDVDIV